MAFLFVSLNYTNGVLKNLNSLDISNVILNYIDAQKRKIWDQDLSRKEFL